MLHLRAHHYDAASSFSTRAAHPLHQSYRRLRDVVAHDEVDLPDIEALLPDARGHQGVVASISEPFDDLYLLLLREPLFP